MDTQDKFDIAQKSAEWLKQLTESGHFTQGNVAELNDHLLSKWEEGLENGLSESAAFSAATASLGGSEEIQAEYGKANRGLGAMRKMMAMATGTTASLGLWVFCMLWLTLVSSIGYLFGLSVAAMEIVMPISAVLSIAAVASLVVGMVHRPMNALHWLRSVLAKHKRMALILSAAPWVGAFLANLLSVQWYRGGEERWHIWDCGQYVAILHPAFWTALGIGLAFGIVVQLLKGPRNSMGIALFVTVGAVIPFVFPALAQMLPALDMVMELGGNGLLLVATVACGILLHRTSKRKLWPA